jgi:hypothetical protein
MMEIRVVVLAIAQREREREEVIGVLTNGTTWRQGYRDGRAAALNGG